MSTLSNWFRLLVGRAVFRRKQTFSCISSSHVRTFADKPDTSSKQIMVQGTENEERLRVRRARPADVPRVLRFVREHARTIYPGIAVPPSAPQLVLCDYIARALAQGHSMVAEQQEARRGWALIRGLALGVAVCPWDATTLEKWARCVPCARSRRLMSFTAHCLRAPSLHEKYHVHKILQVILIVPQDKNPKSAEIVKLLTKNTLKRGQEAGFPLIRFDVTCDKIAKSLEELKFKKEWQLCYDVLPEPTKEMEAKNKGANAATTTKENEKTEDKNKSSQYKHRVLVYTALTGTS